MAAPVDHRGQATVEVALCLPLLVAVLLIVVQVGLVVRDRVAVGQAARTAARAAIVEPSPATVRSAAARATGLDPRRLDVELSGDPAPGGQLAVTVRYHDPTDVPLVGSLLPDVALSERLVVTVE